MIPPAVSRRVPVRARRAGRYLRALAQDPRARQDLPRRVKVALRRTPLPIGPRQPRLPAPDIPTGPVLRPGLRVAVILDAFTSLALRYEWDQVPVTPEGWREELAARPPALLFVESTWNGNDGAWRLAMSTARGPSEELRALVGWCRQQGVPTVFWNKEDPPNYDRFVETARLFDHVLTVDAERIPAYRQDLGHDRVGLLPFGAQPRIHNPVRRGLDADHDVAFAGSYFTEKHPERRAQMDYLLGAALDFDLHIYARMATADPRYSYPDRFARRIVGTLPYEQMLTAAHAYKVFLNVNSVTRSPTMCARRLFELSAAQTPVLSGPAASIEPFFGDDITVVTDRQSASRALTVLLRHKDLRDRVALRAHRRVYDSHLYRHRVNEVLRTVGLPEHEPDTSVSAVVPTMRPDQVENVLGFVAAQAHPDLELVLVTHGFEVDEQELRVRAADRGIRSLTVRGADTDVSLGACMNLGVEAASGRYVAKMDDDNYYAPHYLSDLVRVFEYTDAQVTGKWAHYAHLTASRATILRFPHAEHRYTDLVQGGTILARRDVAAEVGFADLPRRVDTTFLERVRARGGRVYSADRFNFVSVRNSTPDGHTWPITDMEILAKPGELVGYGDPREHVTT